MSSPYAKHWALDPAVVFLNHGSFGAAPTAVLDHQSQLRAHLESDPVRFLSDELETRMDQASAALGAFIGADPSDLAAVSNATTGVNSVLRSLDLKPGAELLTTDHEYNACRNALDYVADRAGATVVVAEIPYPITSSDQVVEAVMDRVTPSTTLALLDHITSDTALVLPIVELVDALNAAGIDTLVDGAHGPGMVPLDLNGLGAAYYTGNCHKWICAPKGAAFLWVRQDKQAGVFPTVISHGANSERTDRTPFQLLFDWTGTADATAYLSVPASLEFMGGLLDGGWPELMDTNRSLALAGRDILCEVLDTDRSAPDDMIGSMAAIPLAPASPTDRPNPEGKDPLELELAARHGIRVPITQPWGPLRSIRISAQIYNDIDQYRRLAEALTSEWAI